MFHLLGVWFFVSKATLAAEPQQVPTFYCFLSHGFRVVLVNRLNRAFRNNKLAHEFEEFIKIYGVRLVSRMEPGNTDTAGEMFVRSIHHSMSEYTSNQISEDVKRTIQTRLEAGLANGGTPKPGYDSRGGRLFVVEEDAAVISEIFEMAVNGMAPMEIVNDLRERKIRTRRRISMNGKETGGQRFNIDHVHRILRDPIYKGVLVHEGTEYPSVVETIVSAEMWDKAQIALKNRPKKKENIVQERDKNFLPLKGKIRCGCCNSAMKPSFSSKRKSDGSTNKYFYYQCSKHEKLGDESKCRIGRVPARVVESLLLDAFGEIASKPEIVERMIEKTPKSKTTKIRALAKERKEIRDHLKSLDIEVKSVTEKVLQFSGTVVGDALREKIEELTKEKHDLIANEISLNKEIDALKSDILEPKTLQQALGHFAEVVKCLSEAEQRELYQLLFKSIIVNEGGKARDPAENNTVRTRESRKHLSVEVRLRTEAIRILCGENKSPSRKERGFTIPLEIAHCRKKPMENCAILSPIHKECGLKPSKSRKHPQKTKHEIHRAIQWKKEMEELGVGQNEFARVKKLSNGAVSHVLKWLELSQEAQTLIVSLNRSSELRTVSRNFRKHLLELPPAEQTRAIRQKIQAASKCLPLLRK